MKLANFSKNSARNAENFFYHKKVKMRAMNTQIPYVILDLNRKISIPLITPITVGLAILSRHHPTHQCRYRFGMVGEDIGIVRSIEDYPAASAGESRKIAVIEWENGAASHEYLDSLIAVDDYHRWLEKENKQLIVEPLYHVDQVLFIKPNRERRSSVDYPAVGSPFETDLKITEVTRSRFGSVVQYVAYIPHVGYREFSEKDLITARDRERMLHNDFKEYFFTGNAEPFFKQGEKVKTYDGYLYNMEETVIIKLNDVLRKSLSWSIKQETLNL